MKKRISRKLIALTTTYYLLITVLAGCDAFARKFTRKHKGDESQEVMVLAPEEWKGPGLTKEQLYRQYFLFWKSWQDELIESFLQNKSQKKRKDCAEQAIKNLVNLKPMLNADKQKKLDVYLSQLKDLLGQILKDPHGTNNESYRYTAEKIKRNLLRDFSYNKIKSDLV